MRNDFIIDFETIGQVARKVPVIDCSYLVFSWDRFLENPYSLHELKVMAKKSKLSIEDQVKNYDFEYRKEDLNWWMEQPKIVRKNLTPKPDDLTVKQFMEKLIIDLRGSEHIDYWWTRSNTFDPVILEHLAMSVERQSELNELLPRKRPRGFWAGGSGFDVRCAGSVRCGVPRPGGERACCAVETGRDLHSTMH